MQVPLLVSSATAKHACPLSTWFCQWLVFFGGRMQFQLSSGAYPAFQYFYSALLTVCWYLRL